ncbi:hypothetical protein [Lutibacter sp.]
MILIETMKPQVREVYINTLIPNFEFKSKSGAIVRPENCGITILV